MNRLLRVAAPLGLALGAAVLWGSTRMAWLSATVGAEQLGTVQRELTGALWAPEAAAIALGLLAMAVVLAFLRGTVARIVAVLGLLLAAAAAVPGLLLLTGGPDQNRVHSIMTTTQETARTTGGAASGGLSGVPEWAEVGDTTVHPAGPVIAALGALVGVAGAAAAVIKPAAPKPRGDKYRTPGQLREAATDGGGADLSEQDSDRLLWDSLDAGEDPTGDEDPAGGEDPTRGEDPTAGEDRPAAP